MQNFYGCMIMPEDPLIEVAMCPPAGSDHVLTNHALKWLSPSGDQSEQEVMVSDCLASDPIVTDPYLCSGTSVSSLSDPITPIDDLSAFFEPALQLVPSVTASGCMDFHPSSFTNTHNHPPYDIISDIEPSSPILDNVLDLQQHVFRPLDKGLDTSFSFLSYEQQGHIDHGDSAVLTDGKVSFELPEGGVSLDKQTHTRPDLHGASSDRIDAGQQLHSAIETQLLNETSNTFITGGFSEPDYLANSAFDLSNAPDLLTAHQFMHTVSDIPNFESNNFDMNRRRISEPYGMGYFALRDDEILALRMEEHERRDLSRFQGSVTRQPYFPEASQSVSFGFSRPGNPSDTQHHRGQTHGRNTHRSKMGQEASHLRAAESLKHADLTTRDRPNDIRLQPNGWTPVNGSDDRPARQERKVMEDKQRKRKRSPNGNGTGIATGSGAAIAKPKSQGTSRALQYGLGISLPQASRPSSASSSDSPMAPAQIAANGASTRNNNHVLSYSKSKDGKSKTHDGRDGRSQRAADESESDVDTDALGFLQRVAAASSDDEEEQPAVANVRPLAASRPRPIQPNPGLPHGWQPPPAQPPMVGTHYTIYSPHVQAPSYAPAKSVPQEAFDPNAPLSAHEEAQLRDEGRFTKMEQSFLRDAIDEYCKTHNISVELANDYVCGKAREGNIPGDFWDEVCRALPQRTKNSIQRAAKRVFRNNQKKGAWTTEEETALAQAYAKAPDQWARICEEVPGRSAEQCRDRWRNYTQNGGQLTRGPWTDEEEAQFVEICKHMLQQARVERENSRQQGRAVSRTFDPIDHLNFTAISASMQGKRSRLHCRNKWHKLKKRPDVEAAIEAIVNGESPPPTVDGAGKENKKPTPEPKVTLAPLSAPLAHGQQTTTLHPQLPTVSQALASLLPPVTRSFIPALMSTSAPAPTAPMSRSTPPEYPPQTHHPKPSSAIPNGFQSRPTPALSHAIANRPTLPLTRTPSASAPPLPPPTSRPSLPPPTSSAPAIPQTSGLPAILAPFPEPRPIASLHEPTSKSVAPPSWVNAPPRVPQLFPTSAATIPASTMTSLARRTVDITRASDRGTGLCAAFNGVSYGEPSSGENHSSMSAHIGHGPTIKEQETRGPMLAPIKPIPRAMPPQQQRSSAPLPAISSACAYSSQTASTPASVSSVMAATSSLALHANKHDAINKQLSTPPALSASLPASGERADTQPASKKQKTAKIQT